MELWVRRRGGRCSDIDIFFDIKNITYAADERAIMTGGPAVERPCPIPMTAAETSLLFPKTEF